MHPVTAPTDVSPPDIIFSPKTPPRPSSPVVEHQEDVQENAKKAEAQQELFNAGVQEGLIARVPKVEEPQAIVEAKINACIMEILTPVIKVVELIRSNVAVLLTVTPEQQKAVVEYRTKVSVQELALYNHLSNTILSQCQPMLAILPDQLKPAFSVLIQIPLQQKMPEAVKSMREISPEFMHNVLLVAYKPKIDELIKSLESVDVTILATFCEVLVNDGKIDDVSVKEIRDVAAFVQSVPEEIRESIRKCLIKAIDVLIKK